VSEAAADFKARLDKAAAALREARRLLGRAEHWPVDEDVLDLHRELRGLIVLAEESYRSGVGLDPWAIDLWLHEHGYKRSPEEEAAR
jgi:hypothetical protein